MVNLSKISLVLTVLIQFSIVLFFKLLDNFSLIITISIISLVCGFLLKFYSENGLKKIGWGLFYGSIIALVLIGGFIIWLEFNYPK